MDSETEKDLTADIKSCQEDLLLEIIKELCGENSKLSVNLKGKVSRIIANCDLKHYTSLHKLSAADESTSTLLEYTPQKPVELTFEEQAELNHAIVQKIQEDIPTVIKELKSLKQTSTEDKYSKAQLKELQESLNDKLNTLQKQEIEKAELIMEGLNHRLNEVTKFSDDSSELLTLKTRIMELKSKILQHLIHQYIFTETSHSVEAYSEIYHDLKDSIKETEQRIQHYKDIIASDTK